MKFDQFYTFVSRKQTVFIMINSNTVTLFGIDWKHL